MKPFSKRPDDQAIFDSASRLKLKVAESQPDVKDQQLVPISASSIKSKFPDPKPILKPAPGAVTTRSERQVKQIVRFTP
jgi:hypothetical protein